MKKLFIFFTALLVGSCFCVKSIALGSDTAVETVSYMGSLSAKSAVLMNAESREIYFEKNADTRLGMASTTKIMTALVAAELCSSEKYVTVPAEAVGVEGSSIYLTEGERLTMGELLHALLLSSANDAAVAIAISVSGSVEAFVEEMNAYAERLGLRDTHFVNPHGLYDEEHYTTAAELAKIAAAALENELIAKIVSLRKATISHDGVADKRLLVNHNRLLSSYEGAIGMKTGFTKKTGRTLVSAARRDGLTLIAVTLDAPDDWNDHTALLDYGFASYEKLIFYPAEGFSYSLPLCDSRKDSILLTNTEPLTLTLPKGERRVDIRVEGTSRFLVAPAKKGEFFGTVTVTAGETSVSSPLIIAENADALTKPKRTFFERISDFFTVDDG